MIRDITNPSSIIIHDKLEPCIFCLSDDPQPIIYNNQCDCHPLLHINCMDEWNKIRPNTCPICLKQSNLIKILPVTNICTSQKICKAICVLCCCTLCFSPLIIAITLATLFSSDQIFGNHSNSTKVI